MTEETKEQTPQNPIERAEAAAARLEAANKQAVELAERTEAAAARAVLGGRSDAGQAPIEKKEESNVEYVERALKGGIDGKKETLKE